MEKNNQARINFIIAIALSGTIGVFVRGIALPSGIIAMARGFLGVAFLLAFTCLRGQRIHIGASGKKLAILFISGAVLGINWMFLFEAYRYTTVATATLCYYLAPVIVILTSPLFLKERLTPVKIVCVVIAFIGMIFVSGVAGNGLPQLSEMKGVLYALAAAVFYAALMILNKRIHEVSSYERTAVQLFAAGVVMIPYSLLTASVTPAGFQGQSLILLLIVGIVHTGVIYLLYFGAMDHLSGQTVSMLGYIDPIVAVLCSVLILREGFSLNSLIGTILILGAAIVSEMSQSGHLRKRC
ncbi:MAG: EamA family transporter [Firmicutes bacterium]|nr:EamA family transporter [Bacillota bacterium]